MRKGVLELCVLGLLHGWESYGYEIVRQVHRHFPEVQESTVYAVLRRLRAEGALLGESRSGAGGPVRKYYRLSPQGEAVYAQLRADWQKTVQAVEALCR